MTKKSKNSKSVLGLEEGIVNLVQYSPEWQKSFEEEKSILQSTLGQIIKDIQHIGSTAIPNLMAKPIIDIGIAIENIQDVQKCVEPLKNLGYEYKGEFNLPGRHFFIKGNPRTHHIHIVEQQSNHWKIWILFRDYLRNHEEIAKEYESLKIELAKKYKHNRQAYIKEKAPFIEKVVKMALSEK